MKAQRAPEYFHIEPSLMPMLQRNFPEYQTPLSFEHFSGKHKSMVSRFRTLR